MGMVYRRKDSPFWWVWFYDKDGNRVHRSTKQTEKKAAWQEAARIQYTYRPRPKITTDLEKIKERYLKYSLSNKSLNVYKLECIILNRFCAWAGNRKVDSLLLEDYKEHRLLAVEKATINREYNAIQAMFKKAVSWDLVESNPCQEVKRYKIDASRKTPNYFTGQQVDLILYKSEGTYLHDPILLDVHTGLRKAELIFLQWHDINFANWTATVQAKDELHWQPKSGKFRVVPIPQPCHKMLLELKAKTLSPFVFANSMGGPRKNNLTRDIRKFLTKIGLYSKGVGWHTFRHTYASHLAMKGRPLKSIAELLGHRDSRTTEIYSHLSQAHLAEVVDGLEFGETKEKGPVTKSEKRNSKT